MDHQAMASKPIANLVLNRGLLKLEDDEKLSLVLSLNDLKVIVPKLKELLMSDQKEYVFLRGILTMQARGSVFGCNSRNS